MSFFAEPVAILLLRTVTGILFFFQGYDKIFNVKIPNVVNAFTNPYSSTFKFPSFILKPAVLISSWIELIGGIFLFLGFLHYPVLFLLSADLIFVALAFSMMKPMWDMQYFFPRLIFVFLLLLSQPIQNIFSLDYVLKSFLGVQVY